MNISRKETAWKKNRKFGDVKGGRTFPKITDRIFNRKHSLRKPSPTDELPIFIKDNPSKDFYFPVTEDEILERLDKLPTEHRENVTHIWLRKVKKDDYEKHETFQGMFICGSGVNLIVLSAFPTNLRMSFGNTKPTKRMLKLYSDRTQDLRFDEKKKVWFLQWNAETIRDYYLNSLLLHEIGHFVESVYEKFWSNAGRHRREDFADSYARIWSSKMIETLETFHQKNKLDFHVGNRKGAVKMKRQNRVEIAQNTLEIIEKGNYRNNLGKTVSIKDETVFAVENTKIYRTEDFPSEFNLTKIEGETTFEVTDETTLEATKRICKENADENPFVLNFASAKNPGGGFLSGSQAQEESLARSSSLYATLTANFEFYEFNRRGHSCFYSDWMIYSPKVPVFRNDDGSLVETPYLATILTSPAVNAGVIKQKEPDKIHLIETVNRERARKFLWLANKHGHKTLILGAWGCGVFQNDANSVAKIFAELLKGEFANRFNRVIMAIYDTTPTRKVYQAFVENF